MRKATSVIWLSRVICFSCCIFRSQAWRMSADPSGAANGSTPPEFLQIALPVGQALQGRRIGLSGAKPA